jgi:hypothetical protein
MAFEVYTPRQRNQDRKPGLVVSLSKNSIVLNKPTRELLQQPEFVELAYDADAGTIRIRPADKGQGISLKKTKVFAKGFFDNFKIVTCGKFVPEYDQEENALCIAL